MDSDLLHLPTPQDLIHLDPYTKYPKKRKTAAVVPSRIFYLDEKSYNKQYSSMYYSRLQKMRTVLLQPVSLKWGNDVPRCEKILDIDTYQSQDCVAIGTIYKEMPLVPRILQQYNNKDGGGEKEERISYCSEEDTLYLEDETGRTQLVGKTLKTQNFVTGISVVYSQRSNYC